MHLKRLELAGFKSFAKTTKMEFPSPISGIVGPNGSGKSNIAEGFKWVLGEQSIKSLRGKKGEDLIFNGSQTAAPVGKASVSLVFDNKDEIFPIDYDEVKITRKVFRDGKNDYLINDSLVRFKDVIQFLSNVGIGTSSYHIISQGDTDRILNASIKERHQMIADALGLKIYQIKKIEAERRLEKTEENMRQVEALKKEIQPHLRFLKKQAEKMKEASFFREKLKDYCSQYFFNEKAYLKLEEDKINAEKKRIEKEIAEIKKEQSGALQFPQPPKLKKEIDDNKNELREIENKINDLRARRNLMERELGRLEGMLEISESERIEGKEKIISREEANKFTEKIENHIEEALAGASMEGIKNILREIKKTIKEFMEKIGAKKPDKISQFGDLKNKQKETQKALRETELEEAKLLKGQGIIKNRISEAERKFFALEKEKYQIELQARAFSGLLDNLKAREENIRIQKEEMERDLADVKILLDHNLLPAKEIPAEFWKEERGKIKREIERLKIKIEDAGGINEDLFKEYEEVKKRDEFFDKELDDLRQAIKSIKELLKNLEQKINEDFKTGIEKINKEFQSFFAEMFGGGKAELRVVRESKERIERLNEGKDLEEGVIIIVNLPKKRIRSLDMLSGGERALTSIALLFAMSQVNPPPFLILDETDAALDEANSCKYAQILKNLSRRTQLIVITHNRETMKQAGILYGITMGADSISKLLSIKFSEAEQYTNA